MCRLRLYSSIKSFQNIISCRDDFVRDSGDEDCWLLNPKWRICPTICFNKQGIPMVLTCRDHNSNQRKHHNSKFMIHVARIPEHILPAPFPDQLCHVCIKPRTLKPMKRCRYSVAFQMHEQKGSFSGIDTCSCTTLNDFSINSHLLTINESRSISHRPDITALLNRLVSEKKLSKFTALGKLAYARNTSPAMDFGSKYLYGATYVPFNVIMCLHNDTTNGIEINCYLDDRRNERGPVRVIKCKRPWNVFSFPCQGCHKFGVMFPVVPSFLQFQDQLSGRLWLVTCIFTYVEPIWSKVASMKTYFTGQWEGWLLTYVSSNIFCNIKGQQNKAGFTPFKRSYISNVQKYFEKIRSGFVVEEDVMSMEGFFNNHDDFEFIYYPTSD